MATGDFVASDRGVQTSADGSTSLIVLGMPFGETDPRVDDALLELPDGVAEDEVVDAALRRGVRVYGLSRYRVDAERSGEADVLPSLVLGFGNVNEDRIRRGVEVLGRILSVMT